MALTTQSVVFTEGRISTMNKKASLRTTVLVNSNVEVNYDNDNHHHKQQSKQDHDHLAIDEHDETAAIIPTIATSLSEENGLIQDEFV